MMSMATPPRFVPTLTEIVSPAGPVPADAHLSAHQGSHQFVESPGLDQLEEQIVHRVMQRVDLVLERRLREAVGQVILAHTQALGPRLREEIDLVVRESVSQAIAQELPVGERSS